MRKNEWATRFAAARRATDKAYCAAAERAIAFEGLQTAKTAPPPPMGNSEAREAIARAFGRPLN